MSDLKNRAKGMRGRGVRQGLNGADFIFLVSEFRFYAVTGNH